MAGSGIRLPPTRHVHTTRVQIRWALHGDGAPVTARSILRYGIEVSRLKAIELTRFDHFVGSKRNINSILRIHVVWPEQR